MQQSRRIVALAVAGVVARGRDQDGSGAIDAEAVLGGEVDEILGIDGAEEVIVQVAALGHAPEKGQKKWRLVADGVEVPSRALLRGRGFLRARGSQAGGKKN